MVKSYDDLRSMYDVLVTDTHAARGGGDANIIPPSNSKPVFGGSVDTLVLGVYVDWSESAWKVLPGVLDELKHEAQEQSGRNFLEVDKGTFRVFGAGRRTGGAVGPVYAWQMESEGVNFSISRQQFHKGLMPNVIVSCGSLYCMSCGGILGAWGFVKDVLEFFGATVKGHVVSRVDLAVDVAGVDVKELFEGLLGDLYVSRAVSTSFYRESRRASGLQVGSGKIVMRAYDKALESEGQEEKRDFLMSERWGGVVPERALRVEYQLRREALSELGVRTVEEFVEKACGVCHYLTHDWFRMCKRRPSAENQARAKVSDLWAFIQDLFAHVYSDGGESVVVRHKRTVINVKQLKAQGIGCFLSVFAAQAASGSVTSGMIEHLVVGLVRSALRKKGLHKMRREIDIRRMSYRCKYPMVA